MPDRKKAAAIIGAGAGIAGLLYLTTRAKAPPEVPPEAPPEVPPFAGFSLMITNPPEGTAYWGVEQGLFSLGEAAWWTEAPASVTLQIYFLDANYECPIGDPDCEGIEVSFRPQDGQHYLVDCATGEVMENPTPPAGPPPPPTEPSLISADIPPTKVGEGFMPKITLYLPDQKATSYRFTMGIKDWGDFRTVEFLPSDFIPYLEDPEQYRPLNNPEGVYEITGCLTYIGEWPEGYWTFDECLPICSVRRGGRPGSCGRSGTWLPPGDYSVTGRIRTNHVFKSGTEIYYTVPQAVYDLGVIGILTVEPGVWLELSNFRYPSYVAEGELVTLSVDVTNRGTEPAVAEVNFRTGYVTEGGGYTHSEVASVSPGETTTVSWTFQMPLDCPFTGFAVYVEIEGVGQLRGRVEVR